MPMAMPPGRASARSRRRSSSWSSGVERSRSQNAAIGAVRCAEARRRPLRPCRGAVAAGAVAAPVGDGRAALHAVQAGGRVGAAVVDEAADSTTGGRGSAVSRAGRPANSATRADLLEDRVRRAPASSSIGVGRSARSNKVAGLDRSRAALRRVRLTGSEAQVRVAVEIRPLTQLRARRRSALERELARSPLRRVAVHGVVDVGADSRAAPERQAARPRPRLDSGRPSSLSSIPLVRQSVGPGAPRAGAELRALLSETDRSRRRPARRRPGSVSARRHPSTITSRALVRWSVRHADSLPS